MNKTDKIYCPYSECKNITCERNIYNLPIQTKANFRQFPECENFKAYMNQLREEEEAEMWREVMQEAHDLDGGTTLKAKGSSY